MELDKVLKQTCQLLKNAPFDWAFCGGRAIDLFCGKQTRTHGDTDICVFSENRSDVIKLMRLPNWTLYDYCGGGVVHLASESTEKEYASRNLCCVKDGNELVRFVPLGANKFRQDFKETNQVELDYIDFLFNERRAGSFVCQWPDSTQTIGRALDKAILYRQGTPHVAPEISLLFKSHTRGENSEHDFMSATAAMNTDQKAWLSSSLKLWYPDGHPWIEGLGAR